jgi:predicted phage replisome organizer
MSISDSKRYFWLKLKEDFFNDEAIDWLEEQKNGKEYVLFYLKLCLKSLQNEGVLIRTVGNILVPYDAEKLGEITKTNKDTVVVALELLQRIGLVELQENGALYLTKLNAMVGSETNAAARMRAKRKELKLLQGGEHCSLDVHETCENRSPEYRDKSIEYRDICVSDDTPPQKTKKPKKKFIPPTLEDVRAYIVEKKLNVNAQKFFDYYDAGDWHDAKGKAVKNWKQKCLTWDKHDTGNVAGNCVEHSNATFIMGGL